MAKTSKQLSTRAGYHSAATQTTKSIISCSHRFTDSAGKQVTVTSPGWRELHFLPFSSALSALHLRSQFTGLTQSSSSVFYELRFTVIILH